MSKYYKEYKKEYYQKNKERLLKYRKIRYYNNREVLLLKQKEYEHKNKDYINARKRYWNKKTDYKIEKTPYQIYMREIRKISRLLYPLINQQCDFCLNVATEHHHYTNPANPHLFNYVCKDCHMKIHNRLHLNEKEVMK